MRLVRHHAYEQVCLLYLRIIKRGERSWRCAEREQIEVGSDVEQLFLIFIDEGYVVVLFVKSLAKCRPIAPAPTIMIFIFRERYCNGCVRLRSAQFAFTSKLSAFCERRIGEQLSNSLFDAVFVQAYEMIEFIRAAVGNKLIRQAQALDAWGPAVVLHVF